MVFDEPLDGVKLITIEMNDFICLKRGSKYNLMIACQNAVPNENTPVEFKDYLISDEWFDGIYIACDKYYKPSKYNYLATDDTYKQSLLVKRGSDYYFVGPFITGEILLKCSSVEMLSSLYVSGRVVNDGSRNLIIEPVGKLVDGGTMGKYFPYYILGSVDNIYDIDIDCPFQILEKDGKMAIFDANTEIIKSAPIENGKVDLDKFLVPYISQDKSEKIYWFEDIDDMEYIDDEFECVVKIDGKWELLKH